MKCDSCHKTKYPVLFTFEFCDQKFSICPVCSASLLHKIKHYPAYIVSPIPPMHAEKKGRPGSLRDRIARRAQEVRAAGA